MNTYSIFKTDRTTIDSAYFDIVYPIYQKISSQLTLFVWFFWAESITNTSEQHVPMYYIKKTGEWLVDAFREPIKIICET